MKDLATAIASDADDLALVTERIRHRTRKGLLPLAGEPNPGTGRRREYAPDAIVTKIQ